MTILPGTLFPHRPVPADVTKAPHPAGPSVIKEIPVGGAYDDSWQTAWFPVDKSGPLNIVYRTWQLKTRALRHEKIIRVNGPQTEDILNRVQNCLTKAGIVSAIAALLSSGTTAWAAFEAEFLACVGDSAVSVSLDDVSHWTDWS